VRLLRRLVFGIPKGQIRFERRGFRGGTPAVRRRLEEIGGAFVEGYHAALDVARADRVPARLQHVRRELRGFAYEGAAMGLALLDAVTPWGGGRWAAFLAGPGAAHAYMVFVGAGWAAARLGERIERFTGPEDPLLRWLVFDGFGFHDGYFRAGRAVDGRRRPRRLSGYALRAYDQGLGRSLWFVEGAEPGRVARTIGRFEADRHADLWAGVGLAAAYAGGVGAAELRALRDSAGPHLAEMAQGAAFAAQARVRAETPATHTELACEILCETSARDAAAVTQDALRGLTGEGGLPEYETWRRRVRERFALLPLAAHA
jgi:hypothetical protein